MLKKQTKKPKKIIDLSSEEMRNKDEQEKNIDNKKIESGLQFNVGEENFYNWIVFNLDNTLYMGFESKDEIQALVISKEFYEAFKNEFEL
jgi:hypothetical protein